MKKFIQLLFKKRFKVLKNKKGFSLLEVLVAVAIIGIISAIAVPQFTAQRENAAKVASDTSAANIAKAFQNCVVLNSFANCKSLTDLKISCPGGSTCTSGGTSPNFCAHLHRGTSGQDDFNVCVQVNSSTGTVTRTYGGALLNYDVCWKEITGGSCSSAQVDTVEPGLKKCDNANICGTSGTAGNCTTTFTCKPANSNTGTCNGGPSGTGVCS